MAASEDGIEVIMTVHMGCDKRIVAGPKSIDLSEIDTFSKARYILGLKFGPELHRLKLSLFVVILSIRLYDRAMTFGGGITSEWMHNRRVTKLREKMVNNPDRVATLEFYVGPALVTGIPNFRAPELASLDGIDRIEVAKEDVECRKMVLVPLISDADGSGRRRMDTWRDMDEECQISLGRAIILNKQTKAVEDGLKRRVDRQAMRLGRKARLAERSAGYEPVFDPIANPLEAGNARLRALRRIILDL